jgi:alkylation response protein AidB-like acyl-CoA dehydrogenase
VQDSNGDYIISGSKVFVSGGGVADLYLVIAKTNQNETSAFVVFGDMPGTVNFRSQVWRAREQNGLEESTNL